MEKLAMEKDLAEVVRRMHEFYHEHGSYPADAVHRILGHPGESVRGGPHTVPERTPKK